MYLITHIMAFLSEEAVLRLLDWEELVPVLEKSFLEITNGTDNSPHRLFLEIPEKLATFLLMPSYSTIQNIITCKLVTIFPKNKEKHGKDTISAAICAFDGDDGKLLYTLGATAITEWRTAAASIVGTKYLHCFDKERYKEKTLAVLGSGKQGVIHILGFQTYFKFGTVRLWNRTQARAEKVAEKLLVEKGIQVEVAPNVQHCVKNADVIVVAFSATQEKLLRHRDIKPGAFICVAGTSDVYPSGIEPEVYHDAALYAGSKEQTNRELKDFIEKENLHFHEIGLVISGKNAVNESGNQLVLFQSLGLAIMDNAATKYLIEKHESFAYNEKEEINES